MTLKRKDGSLYRLRRPNHLMFDQTLWTKKEKYTIHNSFGYVTSWSFDTEEEPVIHQPEPRVVEEKPEEPREEPKPILENAIQVWCLPAKVEETVDPLYEEKYTKVKYGNKFIFNAIVEDEADFYIVLWSDTLVTEGSVIFPRNEDKRWWRIYSVSSEDGIYRLKGTISDFHPSFSQ